MQFKKNDTSHKFILYVILGWVGYMSGCASTQAPVQAPSYLEQVQKEKTVGEILARNFEKIVNEKKDIVVQKYLKETVLKNLKTSLDIKLKIFKKPETNRVNYSLPGLYIYLSLSALKGVEFENELAAMIALQLGHLHHQHVVKKVKNQNPEEIKDFFGEGGLFAYTQEELLEADRYAYQILYSAGYDPRGLISVWSYLAKSPSRAVYSKDVLALLIDQTRQMISESAPLRNPIVRTGAFYSIQKRIQQL